ncbi:TPA: hypothetical protein QC102_004739, partial [Bacillus cereus]|nr:hypothetical protein [Bacillus cereus]
NASNGYKEIRKFNNFGKLILRSIYKHNVLTNTITLTYDDNNKLLIREYKEEKKKADYFKVEYQYDTWNRQKEIELYWKSLRSTYPDGEGSFSNSSTRLFLDYKDDSFKVNSINYMINTIEPKNNIFSYNLLHKDNSKVKEVYDTPQYLLGDKGIIKKGNEFSFTLLKDFLLLKVNERRSSIESAIDVIFFKMDDFYCCATEHWGSKISVNEFWNKGNELLNIEVSDIDLTNKYHYIFEEIDYQMYKKNSDIKDNNSSNHDDYNY